MLPTYLFRGDSDPAGIRKLKQTVRDSLLLTNLCSGGSGTEIFSRPLQASVITHVGTGWGKTHFLSFSTGEEIALNYGSNHREHTEVYDSKIDWHFAVMTLDTSTFLPGTQEIAAGLYQASFEPLCLEFQPVFPLLLIDAATHLRSLGLSKDSNWKRAVENAERDEEWLILPTSPFGSKEYSAKLDTACLRATRFFKID